MNMNMRQTRLAAATILLAVVTALAGCQDAAEKKISYSHESQADVEWQKGAKEPPRVKTLYAMAKVLAAQGRDTEARFVLRRIRDMAPEFLPAYVQEAETYVRNRRTDAAVQVLKQGLEVSPQDAVLLNDLGMCYVLDGEYVMAADMFQQAVATQPGNARYRSNLALALGMQGRYDEAMTIYQQILPADEAHYNLGVIAEARGDNERARQEFARAEELALMAQEQRNGRQASVE